VQDRDTHRRGMELLKSKLVHRQDPSTGAEIETEAHNELEEASVVYSLLAERVDERQAELETTKAELTAMNSSRAMLLNLAAIVSVGLFLVRTIDANCIRDRWKHRRIEWRLSYDFSLSTTLVLTICFASAVSSLFK
jgi:hypothetical protein